METEKLKQALTYILTKYITELNELIYAGAKLVCEKNRGSLKEHEQKINTCMGNSTGNADKKHYEERQKR